MRVSLFYSSFNRLCRQVHNLASSILFGGCQYNVNSILSVVQSFHDLLLGFVDDITCTASWNQRLQGLKRLRTLPDMLWIPLFSVQPIPVQFPIYTSNFSFTALTLKTPFNLVLALVKPGKSGSTHKSKRLSVSIILLLKSTLWDKLETWKTLTSRMTTGLIYWDPCFVFGYILGFLFGISKSYRRQQNNTTRSTLNILFQLLKWRVFHVHCLVRSWPINQFNAISDLTPLWFARGSLGECWVCISPRNG